MIWISVGLLDGLGHLQVDVDVHEAGLCCDVDRDNLLEFAKITFVMVGAIGVSTLLCVMFRILMFQSSESNRQNNDFCHHHKSMLLVAPRL